ncbi:MAG: branched-chain amino acid ABC transporter permease [Rhodocyclaceae bacterium]|nr:branched-chain amino acid ABC transporter permease [Rhodocyclaceae bacterium]
MAWLKRHGWLVAACLVGLALPKLATMIGQEFYISVASRVLIWALLATSLNLLVGTGGMVSMGHAAFFGFGAYVVGIVALDAPQWSSAPVVLPLALAATGLLAFAIGSVCLRTRGVYFIMITLAFAQMLFYIFISLKGYGGDDGLPLAKRSPLGGLKMTDDTVFYYFVLAILAACLVVLARLRDSRFGRVLRGIKDNETRMESLGYATFRFKLTAFVIAGALAGLAGALMANQNGFVSPNMLHWDLSGTVLVMVILGGLGSLWGGLAGAVVFMVLEEVLTAFTPHWQIILGLILLGVVFFAPRGIAGLFARKAR